FGVQIIIDVPCFFILVLWQKGLFFVHISKRVINALYYEVLITFLLTILSYIPFKIKASE
ncbi:hypothetical protein B0185_10075, partial [Haemophilus parahaemolyticus]|uniref:hypothetical protein n=1 Tax=Haemophilus parahaemolyticus TaxID=735 RepID=UPI0009C90F7F